jgi:serine/threonine protein kinase
MSSPVLRGVSAFNPFTCSGRDLGLPRSDSLSSVTEVMFSSRTPTPHLLRGVEPGGELSPIRFNTTGTSLSDPREYCLSPDRARSRLAPSGLRHEYRLSPSQPSALLERLTREDEVVQEEPCWKKTLNWACRMKGDTVLACVEGDEGSVQGVYPVDVIDAIKNVRAHWVQIMEKAGETFVSDGWRVRASVIEGLLYGVESDGKDRVYITFKKVLGQGKCKTARPAIDMRDCCLVAHVKALSEHLAREVSIYSQLEGCPSLLPIFRSSMYVAKDEITVKRNIIMPLGFGGELSDVGAITECEAYAILRDLLPGLKYMHDKDLCCRDMKGRNIVLSDAVDGGLKASIIDLDTVIKPAEELETMNGSGTIQYASPEYAHFVKVQRAGEEYSREEALGALNLKRDIWALGVTMFEVLKNQNMSWQKRSYIESLEATTSLTQETVDDHFTVEDLKSPLYRLVRSMLTVEVAERPTVDECLVRMAEVEAYVSPPLAE